MLKYFKDIYKDKDAFLVACGPSLNDIPVCLLNGEITFGVSLAFKYENLNIDNHFIGDENIFGQKYQEINSAKNIANLFVSSGIYSKYHIDIPVEYWYGNAHPHFSRNVENGVHGGGTSTFVAMQFAYYMGVKRLYVVGLDHYATLESQMKQVEKTGKSQNGFDLVETTGEDVNHFTKDFYPKGTKWFVPQVNRMANSYRMAREAFEADGREIWNCSTKTALGEYYLPRKDFWSLF